MCCWITVHLRGGGPFVVSTGTLRVLELQMSNDGTTTVASGATLRITDAGGFYGLLVNDSRAVVNNGTVSLEQSTRRARCRRSVLNVRAAR